jgi:uncharacterized protein (DUF1015 family)
MPEIRPLRGILYDPAVVGALDQVVAPPYDVISKEEQDRLYEQSPYNVIRIDLSREPDRYGAAKATWAEWRARGVLVQDATPAIYAYAQRHRTKAGETLERTGFFCRLHVEEFASGKVLPHEKTLASAKQDRLALQHACRANLSPIFGLYRDPSTRLRDRIATTLSGEPLATVVDSLGVENRLWRVTDPAVIAALEASLADRTVYIADGHHRYETALRYRDERRAATGLTDGRQPFDYVLAFLCNAAEPGLVVFPTHRLVKTTHVPPDTLVEKLRALFAIEEPSDRSAFLAALHGAAEGERRLGVALSSGRLLVLRTRDGEHDAKLSGSTALRRLDVKLLHGLVLEPILKIDAHEEAERGNLAYVKDDDEALDRVLSGEFSVGFLMNATRVEEVFAVSEAGETMPEKSTYFYPKLLTGLVFNDLSE